MKSKRSLITGLGLAAVLAAGLVLNGTWGPEIRERLDALLQQGQPRPQEGKGQPWKAAEFLTCDAVRDRARDFLKVHYLFRRFDEELSVRTFEKFFQILDPGKNVFLAADLDEVREQERRLGEAVLKRNCGFVERVYARYLSRLDESLSQRGPDHEVSVYPLDPESSARAPYRSGQ